MDSNVQELSFDDKSDIFLTSWRPVLIWWHSVDVLGDAENPKPSHTISVLDHC